MLLVFGLLCVFLGFFSGFWPHYRAINWMMRQGTIDVYRNGHLLVEFRMW